MSSTLTSIASKPDRLIATATLHVEVIGDLVCPFCYLGKRRLDTALDAVGGPSEVTWYPYQLNPDMPDGGMDRQAYLASKFGGAERASAIYARIRDEGAKEQLPFDFDAIPRTPTGRPIFPCWRSRHAHGV